MKCSYCAQPINAETGHVLRCDKREVFHAHCFLVISGSLAPDERRAIFGVFESRRHLDRLWSWLLSKLTPPAHQLEESRRRKGIVP
jgi:hypothetical protein